MEFLKKEEVFALANNIENISDASDIINIYHQRVRYIHLQPVNHIDYTIAGFRFGYDVTVNKSDDIFGSKEVIYKNRFNIFKLLKIKMIVKNYERIEKLERIKRIKGED